MKCKLGLHRWEYPTESKYPGYGNTRTCMNCWRREKAAYDGIEGHWVEYKN